MKRIYLIALIVSGCLRLHAQTHERMDKAVFEKNVLNQAWMALPGGQKEDHEDLFFTVDKDTVALAYINWIEVAGTMQCSYTLGIIKDDIFELQIIKCQDQNGIKYIYGYMPDTRTLSILLAEERLKISQGLYTDPDWLELDLVRE